MELELKFALPALEPQLLQRQLSRAALIGRRRPERLALHNIYYDTPEHLLHRHAVVLRLRQIGDADQPRWVQTLKMGGASDSALSRRGEWEVALPDGALDLALLLQTPWAELDPHGSLFATLVPTFTTHFERLRWLVTRADAQMEVALDRGSVVMDGLRTPICELEIELLQGAPDALFDMAEQIGQHLALMPLHLSKAERAYRLAQGTLDAPLRARPPLVSEAMDFAQLVPTVLRESFLQFTANLHTLRDSDAPEVLHQARVGWRRFRSGLKLFQQNAPDSSLPALHPLRALLAHMAALRDLDVAATEVLPLYGEAYCDGDAHRARHWNALEQTLARELAQQRAALRQTLADPAIGCCMLQVTRWLETGTPYAAWDGAQGMALSKWLKRRIAHLAEQVQAIPAQAKDPAQQHRLRILSKRLRYGVESLRPLLPRHKAERWYRAAAQAQTRIGMVRDQQLALALAERLQADAGLLEFMRGAQFGTRMMAG